MKKMDKASMAMGKIAPRKRQAMGDYGSTFGVESHDSVHGGSPITPQGDGGEMADGKRGIGMPVKSKGMMKQAAPKH